ncbi:hypothetical protein CDAR_220401 [Caerostris darwini]|uniref:Uncharacterized protein n=1 Tax=Caerostris darwini TaxID=1538125 RepID=A0AAV4UFJ4_9ARAC|nr:hypothetical protein CDAR_220401 [Caerostris darwini]
MRNQKKLFGGLSNGFLSAKYKFLSHTTVNPPPFQLAKGGLHPLVHASKFAGKCGRSLKKMQKRPSSENKDSSSHKTSQLFRNINSGAISRKKKNYSTQIKLKTFKNKKIVTGT